MDLPYHLKTLPPQSLDVIRYLAALTGGTASKEDIQDAADLSDRGFGKVIRRLVTKGYTAMDGVQVYRLTDRGYDAAEELAAYDAMNPLDAVTVKADEPRESARRLVMVVPESLSVQAPNRILLGFLAGDVPSDDLKLITRVSVINGELQSPQEAYFALSPQAAHEEYWVIAGAYTEARLRVEVIQAGSGMDSVVFSGGMYVDVPITREDSANGRYRAYGMDISLFDLE